MGASSGSEKEGLKMIKLEPKQSFYDLKVVALNTTQIINMLDYKGKKILIVNVASECGYTYQYEDLQKLSIRYRDSLVVIGFPCNQFGGQEPGTNVQIDSFCRKNYAVTFPLTTKVDVKGENQHPVYSWLTQKILNGVGDFEVKWNFNKFLISEKGELIGYYSSKVKPFDMELVAAIESK